jgi:hypothetical protein
MKYNCLSGFHRGFRNSRGVEVGSRRTNLWISLEDKLFRWGIRNECTGFQERYIRGFRNNHSGYQEQA